MPSQSISYPSISYSSFAVGWGAISSSSTTGSSMLRNVKLSIFDGRTNCFDYSYFSSTSQICAGSLFGGRGVCGGDDGGPLYVQEFTGGKTRHVLAGVTSNRAYCGSFR